MTPEQIEAKRSAIQAAIALVEGMSQHWMEERGKAANDLCDLALQSLSQEAVRDEVLEEAASVDQREVELRGWREAIRVLKRDPNAAGQTPLSVKTGSDAEADSRQVESATSACAKPAPAAPDYDDGDPAKWPPSGPTAPDVASMVKRLRNCCTMIGYATSGAERTSHKRNADAAEAALLARLGEGAPLSADYIQTVPDKCDRIIWRGRYYHLPLAPGASDD